MSAVTPLPKKALLIGCNYTGTSNELRGCVNDIVNMSHILTDALDYDLKNIFELRDDNARMLPTRSNILASLNYLVQQSDKLSEIWVHYSGHGSQIRDKNNDEKDGFDEVIVPLDYDKVGFITDDELFAIIKNVQCRMIMVFDSCCSGSICDLPNMFEYDGSQLIKTVDKSKKIENPNLFVYSGCKENQTSADSYSPEQSQGVGAFTDSLLHSFRINHCSADVLQLYMDTCKYIKSRGFTQTPVFTTSSDKPTHVIARPGSTPVQESKAPIEVIVQVPVEVRVPVPVEVRVPYPVEVKVPYPVKVKEAVSQEQSLEQSQSQQSQQSQQSPLGRKTLQVFITNPFRRAFQAPSSLPALPVDIPLGTAHADNHRAWRRIETTLNK